MTLLLIGTLLAGPTVELPSWLTQKAKEAARCVGTWDGKKLDQAAAKLHYQDAIKAMQSGPTETARASLKKCLYADPTFALCWRALAIWYARAGNENRVTACYQVYEEYSKTRPKDRRKEICGPSCQERQREWERIHP